MFLNVVVKIDGKRFGTTATQPIELDQIYSAVPKPIIIDRTVIFNSPIGQLFKSLNKEDAMHELLLWLCEEMKQIQQSKWRPYLQLLPSVDELQVQKERKREREKERERQKI